MTNWYDYPILHGYYTQYDPSIPDTPHEADDVATPFHTPLTTWKSGKVVQADYAPWGGEVFIKPDDGSLEYYLAHLDRIDVSNGQHVEQGQEIGLSGGQNVGGLHPVSTDWSTGPHTHVAYFEGWMNTPVGARSYGPDIKGTIEQLKSSGNKQDGTLVPQQSSDNLTSTTSNSNFSWVNVGLFLSGILLVIGGFIVLFQKNIQDKIKQGINVTEKAALFS